MFRRLRNVAQRFKTELQVYQEVLRHPKTPKKAKWLLGLAIAYALSPIDLIPDFIPILGHLDDLLIVPLLVSLALHWIPKEVLTECRQWVEQRKKDE